MMKRDGFTLIESLVALTILAVLVVGTYTVWQGQEKKSPAAPAVTSLPQNPTQAPPSITSANTDKSATSLADGLKNKIAFVRDGSIWLIDSSNGQEKKLIDLEKEGYSYPFGKLPMWSQNKRVLYFIAVPKDGSGSHLGEYAFTTTESFWGLPFPAPYNQTGLTFEEITGGAHVHYQLHTEGTHKNNGAPTKFWQAKVTLYSETANTFDRIRYQFPEAASNGLGSAQVIVPIPGKAKQIRWVPNNQKVYVLLEPGSHTIQAINEKAIFEVNVDTKKLTQLTSEALIDAFDLSPDGKELVYSVQDKLKLLNLNSQTETVIYQDPSGSYIGNVEWSPKSNRVAVKTRTGKGTMSYQFVTPYAGELIHQEMLEEAKVQTGDFTIKEFSFSPSGTEGVGEVFYGERKHALWLFDFEEDKVYELTEDAEYPVWSS